MRVHERTGAGDDFDLTRLGHAGETTGQLLDDAGSEVAQLVEADFRLAERDAVMAQRIGLVDVQFSALTTPWCGLVCNDAIPVDCLGNSSLRQLTVERKCMQST
jgi:hypothetical protein